MHNLLDQLRKQTPVGVTDVVDRGSSVYIAVRYGSLTGGVVCRKKSPVRAVDLTLAHEDQTVVVAGSNTAEVAGNIWSLLEAQSRRQARAAQSDLVA
jgi:hypothetical protein